MTSLFRLLTRSIRPPTYANTGSVARDHLASERTFLAWIRTGLGFVALGIAVERFSQLDLESLIDHLLPDRKSRSLTSASGSEANSSSLADIQRQQRERERETRERQNREQLLVGMLLGSGGGSIVYGVTRYFGTMRMLERGMFRPSYFGAAGLGILVSGMAGGAYWGTMKRELERRDVEMEEERRRMTKEVEGVRKGKVKDDDGGVVKERRKKKKVDLEPGVS